MARSKSGLFLMELIIAICFFAVASAICVQLFAHAHSLSQRSKGIQMAVINAQSVAEGFRGLGGDVDALAGLWQVLAVNDGFTAWFDDDWTNVAYSSRFRMDVAVNAAAVPAIIDINITDTVLETVLYATSLSRYLGR